MKYDFVYGKRLVEELLRKVPETIKFIYLDKEKIDNLKIYSELALDRGIKIVPCSKHKLAEYSNGGVHQSVVAVCSKIKIRQEELLFDILQNKKYPVFLILDEINDPQNLGAILRTSAAATIDALILSKNRGAGISPSVRKVASGGAEITPIVEVSNLVRTIDKLRAKGVWVYGTDSNAKTKLNKADFSFPCALVLGGEGKGLRRLTKEKCDFLLSIPLYGLSSLNVSVAAGICLYEIECQKTS